MFNSFFENRAAYEVMWKNAVEATDDDIAHADCMLGT